MRADLTRGLLAHMSSALGATIYMEGLQEKNLGLVPGYSEAQRCVRACVCVCVCMCVCVCVSVYVRNWLIVRKHMPVDGQMR